jgi:hypothetical protein
MAITARSQTGSRRSCNAPPASAVRRLVTSSGLPSMRTVASHVDGNTSLTRGSARAGATGVEMAIARSSSERMADDVAPRIRPRR